MTEQTVNEIHSKVLPRDVNVNTGIGSSACVKARGASLEDMEVDDSDLQASLIMFSPQRSSSCTNIDICTQSESKVSVDRDLRELPTQSWKHVVASPDHGTTEVGGVTRKHTAETSSPVPIYDNADADTSVIMLSPSRSIPKVLMDDSPVLCVQSGTPIGNSDTTGGNNADDSVIVLSPQKPVCSVSSGGSVVLCATGGIADTTLSVVQGGSIKEECEGGDCMVGESIIDVSANTMLRALRKIHTFTSAQSPDKGGVSTGHVDCMEGIVGRPGMCSNSASHSDNSSVAKLGSSRDDSNEHVMKEENLSAKEVSIHERVRSVDGESAIKVEQSVDEQPNSSTQMSVDEKVSPKIEQYVGIKLSPKLEHAEYVLAGLGSGCSGYQNELIGSDNKNSMQMDDVNPDLKTEDDSQVIEGTADKPRVSTDTDGDVEMHGLEVNTEVRQSHTRVRQTVTDVVQKGAGAPQRKTRQSRRANESKSACSIARAKTSTAPAEHGDVEMAEPEVHASNVKSVALKEYAGDYIAPEVDKVEADDTARNTGDMEDTENTGSQIDDTENLDSEIGDAADVSGLDSRGSELADIDSVAGDGDGTATDASEGEVSESAQIDSEIGSEAHPASDMDDIEDIPVELEDIADAARGMDGTENVTTEVGNATNDMSESDDTTHATSNMDDKADIAAVVDDTTNDANELESATGATASGEKIAKKRKIQGVHRVRLRKAAKAVNGAKLVQASNDAQMEEKLRLERLMDRQRRIRIAEQQAKQEELASAKENTSAAENVKSETRPKTEAVVIDLVDSDDEDYSNMSMPHLKREVKVDVARRDIIEIGDSDDDGLDFDEDTADLDRQEGVNTHLNDVHNVKDTQGRVLVNLDHDPSEADVFLLPELAEKAKPHQIGGVRFMYDVVVDSIATYGDGRSTRGYGCVLAHSMGLGKSFQTVAFTHTLLNNTPATRVLLLCPVNVLSNWNAEYLKWLPSKHRLKIHRINEQKKNYRDRIRTVKEWFTRGGVLIMGYEMFKLLVQGGKESKAERKKVAQWLLDPGPDLVVCDEGHRIKNSESQISIALQKLRTGRRIVLTGYPLQNNMKEYYVMIDFVRPGLLGTPAEFAVMFDSPVRNGQCEDSTRDDIKLMKFRLHVLQLKLRGFVQRREDNVLQAALPKKQEFVIAVRLSPMQRQLYNMARNLYQGASVFVKLSICMKIWNHPDVLYDEWKAALDTTQASANSISNVTRTPSQPQFNCKPQPEPQHTHKLMTFSRPASPTVQPANNQLPTLHSPSPVPAPTPAAPPQSKVHQRLQLTSQQGFGLSRGIVARQARMHTPSPALSSISIPTSGSSTSTPSMGTCTGVSTSSGLGLGSTASTCGKKELPGTTTSAWKSSSGAPLLSHPVVPKFSSGLSSGLGSPGVSSTANPWGKQSGLSRPGGADSGIAQTTNPWGDTRGAGVTTQGIYSTKKENLTTKVEAVVDLTDSGPSSPQQEAVHPGLRQDVKPVPAATASNPWGKQAVGSSATTWVSGTTGTINSFNANANYTAGVKTQSYTQNTTQNKTQSNTQNAPYHAQSQFQTQYTGASVPFLPRSSLPSPAPSAASQFASRQGTISGTNTSNKPGQPVHTWADSVFKGGAYKPRMLEMSGKLAAAIKIIEASVLAGDRVLFFSQSISTLDIFEQLLQQREVPVRKAEGTEQFGGSRDDSDDEKPLAPTKWVNGVSYFRLDGSTTSTVRDNKVKAFNNPVNDGSGGPTTGAHLFLISIKAGGIGINLVSANRVIVLDVEWNPVHAAQAVCRVYRFGQTKKVYVYRMFASNTMEEVVYEREVLKRGLSTNVVDSQDVRANVGRERSQNLFGHRPETPYNASEVVAGDDHLLTSLYRTDAHLFAAPPRDHKTFLDSVSTELSAEEEKRAKQEYQRQVRMSAEEEKRAKQEYQRQVRMSAEAESYAAQARLYGTTNAYGHFVLPEGGMGVPGNGNGGYTGGFGAGAGVGVGVADKKPNIIADRGISSTQGLGGVLSGTSRAPLPVPLQGRGVYKNELTEQFIAAKNMQLNAASEHWARRNGVKTTEVPMPAVKRQVHPLENGANISHTQVHGSNSGRKGDKRDIEFIDIG